MPVIENDVKDFMKRLRQLEEEHQRLTRLVPDLRLDKEMLQEVVRQTL